MISVNNLKKQYGDVEALKGISFNIKKGEIVGLLGPNGAGKTTALKILTCFMPASSGEATVNGHDCLTQSLEVRKDIGYLPENNPLYEELNVVEHLSFVGKMHGLKGDSLKKAIKSVLKSCGIEDKAYRSISELSKGYRQRVGLASALIHDPAILILDEPTTGLDPNQVIEIRNLIKKLGKEKTVILSTHILSEVEAMCSKVIIINKGNIVSIGTLDEILDKSVRKGATIHATIKGTKEAVTTLCNAIKGVNKIIETSSPKRGYTKVVLVAEDDTVAEKIYNAVVDAKTSLIELHSAHASLEDVFTEITK